MPQPAAVTELSASLRAAYQSAQEALDAEMASIAANPAQYRRVSRLRELQRSVEAMTDTLDQQAADWFSRSFPTVYAIGASAIDEFAWTQADRFAITQLAQESFDDLLAATQHVDDTTKRLVRKLGKSQALLKETTGQTATQAGRKLARLLEANKIHAVRYADGSRHGIGEYSDMLLRTVSAKAHNAGTLNFGDRTGTKYYEVADGSDCGVVQHQDTEKANRQIWALARCREFPLAHPRCRRSFLPRPELRTAKEASEAKSLISDEQQADQTATERARAETQKRRANSRRKVEARKAKTQARTTARATARQERTGVQGDLELDRIGTLPKPSSMPVDPDGLTPGQLKAARKELPALKAKVRTAASEVREEAKFALDSMDAAQMAPPIRSGPGSELFEWYYRLTPQEQQRLRQTWMKGNRQTANPDLIADRLTDFYGPGDFDEQMMRWVEETRRADAGGLLARGKQPIRSRYGGQFDLDGIFGDGTYKVADLFDSDQDYAVRSVASVNRSQAEEFAARAFVKPADGRLSPYQMSEADYVDELTLVEARAKAARPVRSDPEFGDEYSPADVATLRRWDELVPQGIDDAGVLPAPELYRRIIELAQQAGLV